LGGGKVGAWGGSTVMGKRRAVLMEWKSGVESEALWVVTLLLPYQMYRILYTFNPFFYENDSKDRFN
jgi:hypothetical protein